MQRLTPVPRPAGRFDLALLSTLLISVQLIQYASSGNRQTRILRVAHTPKFSPAVGGTSQQRELPPPRKWHPPPNNLVFNSESAAMFAVIDPTTTIHLTFGSAGLWPFLLNWKHFIDKVGLKPALVGAADATMLEKCSVSSIAAVGLTPELGVGAPQLSLDADQSLTAVPVHRCVELHFARSCHQV